MQFISNVCRIAYDLHTLMGVFSTQQKLINQNAALTVLIVIPECYPYTLTGFIVLSSTASYIFRYAIVLRSNISYCTPNHCWFTIFPHIPNFR